MTMIRNLRLPLSALVLAATLALGGCSQGPSDNAADLQQRLTAAEARADAAEKRARNAEALAAQHQQEPAVEAPHAAPPEIADGGENQFGQPGNDTAPIEPAPAVPAGRGQ